MPELPEVEVLRRSLEPHLVGDRIERAEVRNPAMREPIDTARLRRATQGRQVIGLRRRSKYLLIDLEGGPKGGHTLVVHLGMSGRLTLAPGDAPLEPHEHVAFHLRSGRRLRLRDPRRFGLVFAVPTAELEADPHFAHLGVEPLEPGFSGEVLVRAAAGRRGPVKSFLMDAGVVVGVGNIYASETLHRAGVHPARPVSRISRVRWQRVADSAMAVLRQAIAEGGTTLNDFADGEGRSGYFQVSLSVYDRAGEPCRTCGRPVRRIVQANRSTFYCPGCQR
ncbi:MAG TPA: bifunctional DNA-formamidopyrimidine glycosylase/DNA-(apurinic or apyrimidinic site) lyase [Thermoanaerobaculia bacterium]|nr:bifunctional DNA-formamidopyrimidine glycosylase/DNA-(apurinic or apyrimidinic site) lyase [Thermoanaerobaculia bacterium]